MITKRGGYIRNIYLIKLKDLNSGMVICEEPKTRRQWTITQEVFKKFKRSGFSILPREVDAKIYDTFKDKDYSKLYSAEKLEIIQTLLELGSKD